MKRKNITAFYLETILMILIFVAVILILTRVFGMARSESVHARRLTTAVTISENIAEAALEARSPEELAALLLGDVTERDITGDDSGDGGEGGEGGEGEEGDLHIQLLSEGSGKISASFGEDFRPDDHGLYRAEITWEPDGENYVRNTITIRCGEETEPVYTLETGSFKPDRTGKEE